MNTDATDKPITLEDLHAAYRTMQQYAYPLPKRVRLTPTEAELLRRETPIGQVTFHALFGVPVEIVDPIIIAADGRYVP